MELTLTLPAETLVPDLETAAGITAFALEDCVREHLRRKNNGTQQRDGFPKTNYYAKASNDVTGTSSGAVATVTVGGVPGIALHYYGGTVLPKPGKKALAIPISPTVAGIWPSEASGFATGGSDDEGLYAMIWPKGSDHGFIKDTETGDLLWKLVPKATIPADPTVLPTDDEMLGAANEAIWEAYS